MTEFPSIERFKAWLARKPQEEVLASNWDYESCPLCKFLADQGATDPTVSPKKWSSRHSSWADLPNWAREFVYWIDKIKPRTVTPDEIRFVMDLPGWKPDRWDHEFKY